MGIDIDVDMDISKGLGFAWTSKMAKTMDPMLAIVPILSYWAIILGLYWRSRYLLR